MHNKEKRFIFVSEQNNKGQHLCQPLLKTIFLILFKLMSMCNLSNSNQENNFYHLSHTQTTILVGSDLMQDFEISLGGFEEYLLLIDRIGCHWYPEYGEETIITMKDFWQGEPCDIDNFLTEYVKAEYMAGPQNLEEMPLPASDAYENAEVGQRPIFEEQRYLAHIQ